MTDKPQPRPEEHLPVLFQRRCCTCKRIFTTHDIGKVQCEKCDQLQMVMP